MALHYLALAILAPGMAIFGWMAVSTLHRARDGVGWSLGMYFALVIPGLAGAALQIVADDATTLAVAKVAMFICRAGIPVTLIAMVFDMIGRPLRTRTLVAMSVIPTLTLLFSVTNSAHGLVWAATLVDSAQQLVIHPDWGPWYRFVHAPYSYLLLGSMMAIFFLRLSAVSAPQRRSMMLFLIISVGPMLTGLLHSFGITIDRLWLPAISVSLTAPLFLWILNDLRDHRIRPVSYRELIEQIDDPVIGLDLADRVVSINHAASELFEQDRGRLLGRRLPPDSPITEALISALDSGVPLAHEGRLFDVRKSDVTAEDGSRRGQTLTCRDVTAEQRARDELSTSEQLMRTIVENASHGILRLRRESAGADPSAIAYRCVFANAAAATWVGVAKGSLAGKNVSEILNMVLESWDGDRAGLIEKLLKAVAAGQVVKQELGLQGNHNGKWMQLAAEPVDNDVVLTLTDITAPMRRQLAAEQRASVDHLTGILNRHGFDEAARLQVRNPVGGVVLFVDLNEFKQVNDDMGHQAGDRLLQLVASRLSDTCRSQDLVGRYGGDEFVVLAAGLTTNAEEQLIDRVTRSMTQTYEVNDVQIVCTASIGLARFPEHGQTLDALLAHADSEMYRIKRASSGKMSIPGGNSVS